MRPIAPFRTDGQDLNVIRVDRLSVTHQPGSVRGCCYGAK